jgi:hypothetical protein
MSGRSKKNSQETDDRQEEESKKHRAERIEKITAKCHAVVWILAAIAVFIATDLTNLIHSTKLNR